MMTLQTTPQRKQFSTALIWLFCVTCILLGKCAVFAQGSVGVTVTTFPSTVTVGIGSAASFTATEADTPKPDNEWSTVGDATYSWAATSPATCDPANNSSTTVSATYNTAGTHVITATCTVSYSVIKSDPGQADDGMTGTISGSNKTGGTATIYIIGGAITGDNDIHYYCDSAESADWGHLTAAAGQPKGTTYTWSIAGKAQIVQDSAYPLPSTATYTGVHPGSTKAGDVTAKLTYSLNGITSDSPPFPITVHAPVTFVVLTKKNVGPTKITTGDNAYGFTGQELHFQVFDGIGQTIPGGCTWDETWTLTSNGQGPAPPQIGDVLDASGSGIDSFYKYPSPEPTSTTNANGDIVRGPFTHSYSVTDETSGTSGGNVGCPVKTYTNVLYYTYGVVGNGF